MPATRGSKKDSARAITPAAEAVHVPALLVLPGSPQAKHLHLTLTLTLHTQPSLGRAATGKKSLASMWTGSLWWCLTLCNLREAFSRQEYWSLLANTGYHTLLEHHISCCPSRQPSPPPPVPGVARNPATQAAASPPHLLLTGANPSPTEQPQE